MKKQSVLYVFIAMLGLSGCVAGPTASSQTQEIVCDKDPCSPPAKDYGSDPENEAIEAKEAEVRGDFGVDLGAPLSDVELRPQGVFRRRFEYGVIYYAPDTGRTTATWGSIYHRYLVEGGEAMLGLPISDETDYLRFPSVRVSRFEHGMIFFNWDDGQTKVLRGPLFQKFLSRGGAEPGVLLDDVPAMSPRPNGRVSVRWSNGVVYTYDARFGSFVISGDIAQRWLASGGFDNANPIADARSNSLQIFNASIGSPVADAVAGNLYQAFEGGVIHGAADTSTRRSAVFVNNVFHAIHAAQYTCLGKVANDVTPNLTNEVPYQQFETGYLMMGRYASVPTVGTRCSQTEMSQSATPTPQPVASCGSPNQACCAGGQNGTTTAGCIVGHACVRAPAVSASASMCMPCGQRIGDPCCFDNYGNGSCRPLDGVTPMICDRNQFGARGSYQWYGSCRPR